MDWENYAPTSGQGGLFLASAIIPGIYLNNSYITGKSLKTYGSVFGYIGGEANISAMI